MAELGLGLGGLLGGNSDEVSKKVEVEMLDYGFIEGCSDVKLLHDIVSVLKSGKEGYYPDLIKFAETRLFNCMPEKDKKKYAALNHKVTVAEIQEAESELMKWQNEVAKVDATIKEKTSKEALSSSKPNIVPVRGTKGSGKTESLGSSRGSSSSSTSKSADDDDEDGIENLAPPFMVLNRNQRKKIKALRDQLNVDYLTSLQRTKKANLERTKGNESFRNNEYEEAVRCYSKSLAYDHGNAMAFANRAMAYIRMEIFDLAEEDSSAALVLDDKYVKAYSRRGLVRFKRGKYLEAAADFGRALELDPSNSEAMKLLHNARQKYLEVEGVEMPAARPDGSAPAAREEEVEEEEVEAVAPEDSESIPVTKVSQPEELGLPAHMELLSQESLTVHGSSAAFYESCRRALVAGEEPTYVRIAVESDDDSDGDGDDEDENGNSGSDGNREGDKEKEGGDVPATIAGFRRITIEDDEDDDDDDEEEEKNSSEQTESTLPLPIPLPPVPPATGSGQGLPPQPLPAEVDLEQLKLVGNQFMQQKKFAEAIAAYTACLSQDRSYLPALNNRAQAYLTRKEYSAAIVDCCSVLSLESGNSKALYRRAQAYHLSAESLPATDLTERLSFLEQAKADLFELLSSSSSSSGGPAANAEAANLLLSRINKDCEALLAKLRPPADDSTTPSATAASRRELIEQARAERDAAEKAAAEELVLSTGSAEKELGNAAVQKKDMKTALQHYTRAIQLAIGENYQRGVSPVSAPLLSLAVSSFNNRSLAHLKLSLFREAIADASFVADHYLDGEGPPSPSPSPSSPAAPVVSKEMYVKAIFRRAQARHALSNGVAASAAGEKEDGLRAALADLALALAADPANALAAKEQEAVRLALSKLQQQKEKEQREKEKREREEKGREEKDKERQRQQPTPPQPKPLQAMAAAPSQVDMVPRSSKRLQPSSPAPAPIPAPSSSSVSSPATPSASASAAKGPAPSPSVAASAEKPARRAAGDSPAPAFTLAVPDEPPKTTYELERIWRGLKDRPDLFAKYLSVFKKATYKKVVKESVTPDLLSSVFVALSAHTESVGRKLSALEGLTEVQNFLLMVSVLPEQDMRRIDEILAQADEKIRSFDESAVEKRNEWQTRVKRLRAAFKL